ncbi:hypothetical protein F66182_8412 [Fusarium sp. NRRL 66182]|nr:hypothetical protein F66182_8412 [Fusarium sp. NRRL 66182]
MRPVSTLPDGIWVTNAILVRAIERFHHVYQAPYRNLSSCPGPMESRRRLGKRHMTAIIPDSHASPFPWTIELPLNLGEWQWQAPSPAHKRKKRRELKKNQSGLFERFLGWLEDSKYEDGLPIATPLPSQMIARSPVGGSLAKLHAQLAAFDSTGDSEKLYNFCESYLQEVLDMVYARTITTDELVLALDPFDQDFKQRASIEVLENVLARQWVRILKAIAESRPSEVHNYYSFYFWRACFEVVLQMSPQTTTFEFLDELLRTTAFYQTFPADEVPYADWIRKHVMLEASRYRPDPSKALSAHVLRRYIYFGRRFDRADAESPASFKRLALSCLKKAGNEEQRRVISYHLLLKFASLADLSTAHFLNLSKSYKLAQNWPIEISLQFTAARLIKQVGGNFSIRSLNTWLASSSSSCCAQMIEFAHHREAAKRRANFWCLIQCSQTFGFFHELVESVRFLRKHKTAVGNLIQAVLQPEVALEIWELYNAKHPAAEKLSWHVWIPHMEALVENPNVPPNIVWRVANLLPHDSLLTLPVTKEGISNRMDFLERIGQAYLKRSGLTRRQRFRYVEVVLRMAKPCLGEGLLPHSLMQTLTELVVSDLEEGQPGRKARLDYLVEKTNQFYGRQQAARVQTQIDGWRWTIRQTYTHQPLAGPMTTPSKDSNNELEEASLKQTSPDDAEYSGFEQLVEDQHQQTQAPSGDASV